MHDICFGWCFVQLLVLVVDIHVGLVWLVAMVGIKWAVAMGDWIGPDGVVEHFLPHHGGARGEH